MSEKRSPEYDLQLVNRDDVESGGQLIENNIASLAEGNRIEERDKCKRSRTAYIAHLTKQINAVGDLMSDYSKEFQIRHLLSKFEDSLEKIYKSNQEYCKLLIDPEEIDNAMNVFKNQEFRVIEITKTVENFLEECKEFDTLYETNFEKTFDRDIPSKPVNSKIQRSSKSKNSNPKSSISSRSRKSSNSSKSHNSSKSSKSSTNSRLSAKLLLEKQKASILASQAEEKFERQIRLIEMKKELEIETEKEKALNEVIEARNKLKPAEIDLQLGQNSINRLEKIEVYTKTKPVAANQASSVPTNS